MDNPYNLKQLIESVQNLKCSTEQYIEAIRVQAQLYHAGYDALIEQGFTDAQAMDLLKTRGALLL